MACFSSRWQRFHSVRFAVLVSALALLAGQANALAPLEGRTITGERVASTDPAAVMEYDPNLDITWLRDWGASGARSWVEQLVWASNLQVGSFANWSLPTSRNQDGSDPCLGMDCTGSQMGYLWYVELGNSGSLTNSGPFQNMQFSVHWSGTQYSSDNAWRFLTGDGFQGPNDKRLPGFAVAVRPGDVASPIPEPQAWALALAGLLIVVLFKRKQA